MTFKNCSLFSFSMPTAPTEIVSQGETAMRAYQVALEGGSIETMRVRVMIIGQDRTGKSSLIRSLLKKPYTPNDSTIGIDITSATFTVSGRHDDKSFTDGVPCDFVEEERAGTGYAEGEVARAVAYQIQEEQRRQQLALGESEEAQIYGESDDDDSDSDSPFDSVDGERKCSARRSSAHSRPRTATPDSATGREAVSIELDEVDSGLTERTMSDKAETEEEGSFLSPRRFSSPTLSEDGGRERKVSSVAEEHLELTPEMKSIVVQLLRDVKVCVAMDILILGRGARAVLVLNFPCRGFILAVLRLLELSVSLVVNFHLPLTVTAFRNLFVILAVLNRSTRRQSTFLFVSTTSPASRSSTTHTRCS